MEPASANINKKGFSLIEFLIALALISIVALALVNSVVFLLQQRVRESVKVHTTEAAQKLVYSPSKLENCVGKSDPCGELLSTCKNSVDCADSAVCEDTNTCVVCYTNPSNGRKLFYGFVADNITANTYKVTLCWIYGADRGNYTTVISLP